MNGATLVVLAAGMGSRYGGIKQVDRVGEGGETLLDYAVYDALRAGFDRFIFVIRKAIEADFREIVLSRIGGRIEWELAFQESETLIDAGTAKRAREVGRIKPWGTAHALLCAKHVLDTPFAVINADDFYGRRAFAVTADFLSKFDPEEREGAIAAYRLDATLSPAGPVARGVCDISDGYLRSIRERTSIFVRDGRIVDASEPVTPRKLAPETYVSMNFWALSPSILNDIGAWFQRFLAEGAQNPNTLKSAEAYLPSAVDDLVHDGKLRVRVLDSDSLWFGMTYREDREMTIQKIADLIARGDYPASLWETA